MGAPPLRSGDYVGLYAVGVGLDCIGWNVDCEGLGMNPISKEFGFWLLAVAGLGFAVIGEAHLACACLIASLFYEAIKQ